MTFQHGIISTVLIETAFEDRDIDARAAAIWMTAASQWDAAWTRNVTARLVHAVTEWWRRQRKHAHQWHYDRQECFLLFLFWMNVTVFQIDSEWYHGSSLIKQIEKWPNMRRFIFSPRLFRGSDLLYSLVDGSFTVYAYRVYERRCVFDTKSSLNEALPY